MKNPFLIATLLAFGSCTATYTEPPVAADHPANPGAQEAPPLMRSRTLELAAAEPVIAPGSKTSDTGEGEHKHDVPAPAKGEAAATYACPMHPEVTSDKPEQRCPKCGMKLKPKAE